MAGDRLHRCIVSAVKVGKLKEPFTTDDFRKACPGLAEGTYNAFLHKHRVGNPGRNSELFDKVSPGRFRLVRPYKYGIDY